MSSMRALVNNPAPHSWNLLSKPTLSCCIKKYVEVMGMLAWLRWLFQIISNHCVHLQYVTILCVNYTSIKLGKKEQWDEKGSWTVELVKETLDQAASPCWSLGFITCLLLLREGRVAQRSKPPEALVFSVSRSPEICHLPSLCVLMSLVHSSEGTRTLTSITATDHFEKSHYHGFCKENIGIYEKTPLW